MAKKHTGSCLCGAVRFTVEPVNSKIGACHCDTCRRWTSGPFMGIDCASSFEPVGGSEPAIYNSSAWAERGFCRECGTTLFYRIKKTNHAYVSVDVIDELEGISLAEEVFIDEKPDYYNFAEDTNKSTGEEAFAHFAAQESSR